MRLPKCESIGPRHGVFAKPPRKLQGGCGGSNCLTVIIVLIVCFAQVCVHGLTEVPPVSPPTGGGYGLLERGEC